MEDQVTAACEAAEEPEELQIEKGTGS